MGMQGKIPESSNVYRSFISISNSKRAVNKFSLRMVAAIDIVGMELCQLCKAVM
jgi:hypothetical protein